MLADTDKLGIVAVCKTDKVVVCIVPEVVIFPVILRLGEVILPIVFNEELSVAAPLTFNEKQPLYLIEFH